MSSDAYDTLRLKHPNDAAVVGALERLITDLSAQPGAVIDERSVAQLLSVSRERAEVLLVELAQWNALRLAYFWICPTNGGTTWYGDNLADAPTWTQCPDCLQVHYFSEQDIDVHFLPPQR